MSCRQPKHIIFPELAKHAINGVDVAAGVHNFYFRPEDFLVHGIQYLLTGGAGTLKIYGTMDPDMYSSSIVWSDITNTVYSVASLTATGQLLDNTNKLTCFERIKIEVTAADAKQLISLIAVADVADSLDRTSFILQDDAGSVGFWIDVDNSGTLIPAALAAATDRQVEIITVTTDMTKAQVGTAIYTEIIADAKFEAGSDDLAGNLIIRCTTTGDKDEPEDVDTGFTIAENYSGLAAFKIHVKQA